jgi:hypothetical protein
MGDECWLCEDCTLWHSVADCGELEGDRLYAVTSCRDSFVVDCGEDGEFCVPFSWQSCDGCGSSLGGGRHRAFVVW